MCGKCNNNCGCDKYSPCNPDPCGCKYTVYSNCVLYNGEDFLVIGATQGDTLSSILQWIDNYLSELTQYVFIAENTGTGVGVYSGINVEAVEEFKSLLGTESVNVTLSVGEQEILFSVNEEWLTSFIIDVIVNGEDFLTVENLGTGVGMYKDTTEVGNVKTFNFKTFTSDDIIFDTTNPNEVKLKLPSSSLGIPALIVNQDYVPTYQDFISYYVNVYLVNGGTPLNSGDPFNYKGEGTFAKPFTDTRTFIFGQPLTVAIVTPNTSIQNGLDAYQGTGTRLLPQKTGQEIIVQKGNSFYTFTGDFGYSNLKLKLEASVTCTTTGWLIDMDDVTKFDSNSSTFTITIAEEVDLQIGASLGFRNSGNTSSLPPSYDSGRVGYFLGGGNIKCSYNGVDVLTRYVFNGDGNNNDDNLHFQVQCKVLVDYQGVYYTKNKMRIDFYNLIQSGLFLGSVNLNLQAFHMTGGQVRFFEGAAISIDSATSGRNYGFTFEPTDDGIGYCSILLNNAKITGNTNYCFVRLNNEQVGFVAFNSPSGSGFSTTIPGTNTVVNGLFENLGGTKWTIEMKNCVFSYTGIDYTKVDLTVGNNITTINFIGNSTLIDAVRYQSKELAQLSGLTSNSLFIESNDVNSGSFIVGEQYKIKTVGTTDFTLIGAASNTVGLWFTATGVGLGDGVATREKLDILT